MIRLVPGLGMDSIHLRKGMAFETEANANQRLGWVFRKDAWEPHSRKLEVYWKRAARDDIQVGKFVLGQKIRKQDKRNE